MFKKYAINSPSYCKNGNTVASFHLHVIMLPCSLDLWRSPLSPSFDASYAVSMLTIQNSKHPMLRCDPCENLIICHGGQNFPSISVSLIALSTPVIGTCKIFFLPSNTCVHLACLILPVSSSSSPLFTIQWWCFWLIWIFWFV